MLVIICEYYKQQALKVPDVLLNAFAKLRNVSISSVMSVCPSVLPRGTTRLPLDGF
jgi:hypothetical protein